jgi:peroxiredoxin
MGNPKADTPGCTAQACGVRDHSADYEAEGAVVLGVSPDRYHQWRDGVGEANPGDGRPGVTA